MRNKISYKKQRGFTFFEVVIVIVLISILGLFSIDRLLSLRIAAERASVIQVVGNIRSALGLEVVRLALKNNIAAVAKLANTNPIPLLAQPPANYLGEYKKQNTEAGQWYFNIEKKMLVYNVIYSEGFNTTLKGLPRIRHKIKLIYNDNDNNQRFDIDTDHIAGLDLLPVEKFGWEKKSNLK